MTTPLTRRSVIAGASAALVAAALPAPRFERRGRALDRLFVPGAPIETIATGQRWAEGPLWVGGRDGHLLFSDTSVGATRRWSRGDGVTTLLDLPAGLDMKGVREGGTNGLAIDTRGRVLAAHSGLRAIVAIDPATRAITPLAERYRGKRFNSPNDLVVAADGAIWFTDPPYGLTDGDASPLKEQPHNGVYRIAPDGEVTLIDGTIARPNGIALAGGRLYVAESSETAPRVFAYDVAGARAANRRTLFDARPLLAAGGKGLTDGMKAAHGLLFCSAPGGLVILDPAGRVQGRIRHDQPIANCGFGPGAMYLTATDRVFRVPMRG